MVPRLCASVTASMKPSLDCYDRSGADDGTFTKAVNGRVTWRFFILHGGRGFQCIGWPLGEPCKANADERWAFRRRPAAQSLTILKRRAPRVACDSRRGHVSSVLTIWEDRDRGERHARPWRGRAWAAKRPERQKNREWPPSAMAGRSHRRRRRNNFHANWPSDRRGNQDRCRLQDHRPCSRPLPQSTCPCCGAA